MYMCVYTHTHTYIYIYIHGHYRMFMMMNWLYLDPTLTRPIAIRWLYLAIKFPGRLGTLRYTCHGEPLNP